MKRYNKVICAVLASLAVMSGESVRAAGKSPADTVNVPARAGHRSRQTLVFPYGNHINKSLSTGGASTFYEEDINKYPSSDFRNAMTGVIPGLVITEISGMTGMMSDGARGGMSFRGLTPKFVVDGQPVYLTEVQLDPEEIESMTFVKDILDKALFGARSSEGILYITTKRGLRAGKTIKVGVESGVSVVDRMPEYVNGAEYAALQNQARDAAGYPVLYTQDDIDAYALNRPDDLIHPSVDWRGLMFKDTKSYRKANLTVQGGTEAVRYSVYFGYLGEGDFYAAGPAAGYNKMNLRTNADMRITKDIKFSIGLFSGLNFRRSPRFSDNGSFNEFDNYLTVANNTPPVAFPLHVGVNTETGGWIYGLSEVYTSNPYAALTEKGFFTERERSGIVNGTLTWDMNKIAKGLKLESYVGLNVYNIDRIGKTPDYLAMIYDPLTGQSSKTSHEGTKASGKVTMGKWYHQSLYLNERLSYIGNWGLNRLSAAAVYYLETTERSQSSYRDRQQSFILNADYSYADRYLAQVVMNTSGSCMFVKGNRYGVFPSLGLGWVVSGEDFLKGSGWLNYLKLRAQAGTIGYNTFGSLDLFEDEYVKEKGVNFGPASTDFEWIGGATKYQSYMTTLLRLGNKNLTWEKRKELVAGVEAKFFGNRLSIDAGYFRNLRDGIITNTSDVNPKLFGLDDVATYDNYNKIRYQGVEAALNWTDKIGDFEYSVGGWAVCNRGKYLRYSESQINDYNKVEGSWVGDYHGYVYLGKFSSQDDIESSPAQTFDSQVQVGDLKYKDINEDGKIDSNDKTIIGNTSPKLNYAVNVYLKYKGFDFTLVGTGKAFFDIPLTSGYFWNGWGQDNYSVFVRDNIGGDYPRLSYDKITNNFQASRFWLRKGDWFKIQNVELGWSTSFRNSDWIRGIRLFVRGTNLLTVSGIKYIDPESTTAGVTTDPLYRTFTGGVKLNF